MKFLVKADDVAIARLFEGAVGICEATNFEQQCLWDCYSSISDFYPQFSKYSWKSAGEGLMEGLEEIGDSQVCIELTYAIINDKKIVFCNACSRYVDHEMVRKWLERVAPLSCFDNNDPRRQLNLSDAQNFIHLIR